MRASFGVRLFVLAALARGASADESAPWWTKFIPGFGGAQVANATAPVAGGRASTPGQPGENTDWMKWIPKGTPQGPPQGDGGAVEEPAGAAATEPSPAPSAAATVAGEGSAPAAQASPAPPPPAAPQFAANASTAPADAAWSTFPPADSDGGAAPSISAIVALPVLLPAEEPPGSSSVPDATSVLPAGVGGDLATIPDMARAVLGGDATSVPGVGDVEGSGGDMSSLPAISQPPPLQVTPTEHAAPRARGSGAPVSAPVQLVEAPWAKFIPKGVPGGSGGGKTGPEPDPDAAASPLAAVTPFKPAPKAARDMPSNVSGTWTPAHGEAVNVSARFVTSSIFLGGFMGSVVVQPWTPGAIFILNYSTTDVVVQRLFNADILDERGDEVGAFALLTDRVHQQYLVRLHNASVHSAREAPPDSFTFMASGTAQPPQMAVGCDWLDAAVLAPSSERSAVLRYHPSPYPHGAGQLATVEVRPWAVGAHVILDFGGADVLPTWWHNAQLVSASGGKYTVRLIEWTASSDELTPESSFLLKASGSSAALPRLSVEPPADADGALHRLSNGLAARERGGAAKACLLYTSPSPRD